MEYCLCLDSRQMRLINASLSFAFNEGTLLLEYSPNEFKDVLDSMSDCEPIGFEEAIAYVTQLIGYEEANALSKEAIIKIYDMAIGR